MFGRPRPVTNPLRVDFQPTLLTRRPGFACTAGTPSVATEYRVRPLNGRMYQSFAVNGTAGQPGRIWSRVSLDAAGSRWPSSWTQTSYAAAWGPNPQGAPPSDRIDAITTWQQPGTGRWSQEVYAGSGVWSRTSLNTAGTAWRGVWTYRPLAAAWGNAANRPPIGRVDAVTVRSGPQPGGLRQTVVSGADLWYRDAVPAAGGVAWPAIWRGPISLAATWGGQVNHPPVGRIDAYAVHRATDAAGHDRMRQTIVAGEVAWTRLSTDAAGTRWPASWDSMTLASSVGAWTPVGTRPPIYAASA